MWLHKATVRNVTRALKEVKAFEWEGDYRPATRATIKEVIELTLTNEIDEFVARPRYQRAAGEGVIYRNGGYLRRLLTELGDVVIRVPALRRGFRFRALEAYKRRPRHLDRLIMGYFVLGLSTRKVAATLVPLLGERISPQLVSDIARALDVQVARFHARPLKDRYRFLYFDGRERPGGRDDLFSPSWASPGRGRRSSSTSCSLAQSPTPPGRGSSMSFTAGG